MNTAFKVLGTLFVVFVLLFVISLGYGLTVYPWVTTGMAFRLLFGWGIIIGATGAVLTAAIAAVIALWRS